VKFNDDEAFRQTQGDSHTANLNFDGQGRIDHAVLRGDVHTHERVRATDDVKAPWSERTLTADTLDLVLVAEGAAGKAQLRDAKAVGSARLNSVATVLPGTAGKKAGTTTDVLSADALDGHFVDAHGAAELSTVHGAGHTVLEQAAPGGVRQTSKGETLDARFREVAGKKGAVEVAQVVQEGGVVIDRTALVEKKQADGKQAGPTLTTQHATARRASYDADSDKLTLTDGVQMSDPQSTIWASKVVMDRESGDATAEGGVKVTYLQEGAAQPVHVLAARAELNHDAGRATFYGRPAASSGSTSALARMWQAGQTESQSAGSQSGGPQSRGTQSGGSQIEAPVLVFEQESKRLTARSETPGMSGTVHTVLTRASSQKPGTKKSGAKKTAAQTEAQTVTKTNSAAPQGSGQQVPVRITSSELVYSDELRQAVFTGGVRVVDSDGEMRAQEATVFLTPAEAKQQRSATATPSPSSASDGMLGGQVERIIATRHIELTQPGRLATGERLVYMASDQMFVLTGTTAAPPRVVDDEQGTTTGAVLRFHSGDDSVSVLGSDGNAPARKVHTETRVKKQ